MLGSNRDNLGKSLPSPQSLIIPRGQEPIGSWRGADNTFRDTWSTRFPRLRHQSELTEKAWENPVKGLGKENHNCLDTTYKEWEETERKSPLHSTLLPSPLSFPLSPIAFFFALSDYLRPWNRLAGCLITRPGFTLTASWISWSCAAKAINVPWSLCMTPERSRKW